MPDITTELLQVRSNLAALRVTLNLLRLQIHATKANFNPAQLRIPAGSGRDSGRWTAGDGTTVTLVSDPVVHQYNVELSKEETDGGHTIRDHVGKSDAYLLNEVKRVRIRVGVFTAGFKQEGSFDSVEDANYFVNRVLENRTGQVDAVARGDKRLDTLNMRFGFITGQEGYRASGSDEPYVRPTYAVRIVIRHDKRSPRGYRIFTAFPRNQLPGEPEID